MHSSTPLLSASLIPVLASCFSLTANAAETDASASTPSSGQNEIQETQFQERYTISTPLPTWKNHKPRLCLDGNAETHYWSSRPMKKDETFTVTLAKPVKGLTLTVKTGKEDGKDILKNGVLEMSQDGTSWKPAGKFFKGKAETTLTRATKAIRLRATKDQNAWLAIQSITLGDHERTQLSTTRNVKIGEQNLDLTITVETEGFEDLKPRVEEMTNLYFSSWQKIAKALSAPIDRTPTHLFLSFRDDINFPAYVLGTSMVLKGDHLRNNPEDTFGVFTHELCHFVQNYPGGAPAWFVEGTADYIRYKAYPDSLWAKKNKKRTDKSKPLGQYWNSTAFLLWIEKEHKPGAVAIVSRACKEGKYNDKIWMELTGHTLDQLVKAYGKS
ncbi:discoidin domain-containing protein [Verrucomicrobiaceae bacterium N1E253]|uniref:Discoidin domain-containing protein n=1 Tax=Oceaniferula marina TaxID=2748318 RepID=A0A851GKN5_9BACT|nr:basic secretory protein-like protein [Oceaniferula marina]NWK55735.1 discoidin domain-containing protein [Oceaniferula marina]